MSKKPTLGQRYNLRKTTADTGQQTQKNSFRSPEENHEGSRVVQMNARVTPELKERVRIYCAMTDMTYQEFFDEALNYYLDHNPAH